VRNFSLSIPTKTYLKKYLYKRYGYPIQINNQTLIGIVVGSILEKKVHDNNPKEDRENKFATFSDKLELVIPAYKIYSYEQGLHVSKKKAIVINRYFEVQFEEDLYRYCLHNTDPVSRNLNYKGRGGCGYDKAIINFASQYNLEIDVDITFESMKKNEYRFRKKIESLSCGNVPSNFSNLQPTFF